MRKILLVILLPLLSILLQAQETAVIDGVTFSADKKTLIKYPEEKEDQEYIVPEGTEIISYKAFSNNNYLKKNYNTFFYTGNMFARIHIL